VGQYIEETNTAPVVDPNAVDLRPTDGIQLKVMDLNKGDVMGTYFVSVTDKIQTLLSKLTVNAPVGFPSCLYFRSEKLDPTKTFSESGIESDNIKLLFEGDRGN
jgi:hypothetical protein